MIRPIELPSDLDRIPVPRELVRKLTTIRQRIETFQDCWRQHHAAQFVAADYPLVFQALQWFRTAQPLNGTRWLEWGCGFAAVACLADELGFNAHAVEAHPDLVVQARQTIAHWPATVELVAGNFLPDGAEELTDDLTLPSLGHGGQPVYEIWELDLDDFAFVYSYPWPGEAEFHEDVFDRYAAPGAVLLMFIGPHELRAWRKLH
jgi:hypothetical protein